MKTLSDVTARRDRLGLLARRARRLESSAASKAWFTLAGLIEQLETRDVPKLNDLFSAIRTATIQARIQNNPLL